MPQWIYRAERDGQNRTMVSYGQRAWAADLRDLADVVAAETRTGHRYRGELTVWLWEPREDEHFRLPVPADALEYHYGAEEQFGVMIERLPNGIRITQDPKDVTAFKQSG